MITVPNLLLIGAADRNVGKTTLACNIIDKYKYEYFLIGLKITVIKEANGKCPRGGTGCGVCSSLTSNYCITEEINNSTEKDTSKMLQAGAKKVYWLRVLEKYLDSGVQELFGKILKDNNFNNNSVCYICESNSARNAIVPGAFIVINKKNSSYMKPSCQNVIDKADLVITFDPVKKEHDHNKQDVCFNGEYWTLK